MNDTPDNTPRDEPAKPDHRQVERGPFPGGPRPYHSAITRDQLTTRHAPEQNEDPTPMQELMNRMQQRGKATKPARRANPATATGSTPAQAMPSMAELFKRGSQNE